MPAILYADDNSAHLELFRTRLREHYEIHCASSAQEALSILGDHKIKVLIADHRMPEISGVQLMEQVSRQYPEISRIILTAYGEFETVVEAINKGKIHSYLLKSHNTDEIRIAIQNALESSYLREKNQKLIDDLSIANQKLTSKTRSLEEDIRKRKKAEKQLKNSEKKYRELVEHSKLGILSYEGSGSVTFCNQRFLQMFGITTGKLDVFSIEDIVHPTELVRVRGEYEAWITGRKSSSAYEFRGIRKNGSEIYLEVHAKKIRKNKQVIGIRLYVSDRSEEKRTKAIMQSSEERLKILFDYAPDAYYLSDLKGKFVDGNKEAEKIIGYRKEELIGKSFLKVKLLSPDQIPRAAANLLKSAGGKATGPDEFTLKRKDGSRIHAEIRTYPVKIAGKTLVLGIARDITRRKEAEKELLKNRTHLEKTVRERTSDLMKEVAERKKAEEAIRASEEKFRLSFENATIGKSLTTPDGKLSKVNRAFCKLLGYTESELQSKGFADVTHPEDIDKSNECVRCLLSGEEDTHNFEKRYIRKDGKIVWAEVNTMLLRDPEGNPMYFVTQVIDRTERKVTELELQKSESRYRTLIENIPGAVFRCDMDENWTMKYLSESVKNLCGFPARDFIQNSKRSFASIIHPDDVERVANTIEAALGKNRKYEIEYRILHRKGSVIWVYERGQIVVDQNDLVDFIDGIILDVTERKSAQEKIRESEERYSAIANNLPNGYLQILDREYRYVFTGGEDAKLHVRSPEAITGKTIRDVLGPETADLMQNQFKKVLKGKTVSFEQNLGKETFLISAAPLKNTENEVSQILALSINITERKKARKELEKERIMLNTFMGNVPDFIYFKDMDSRFTRINNAQAGHLGLGHPKEALGKTDFDFFSEEHARQAFNDEKEIILKGEAIRKEEKETWPDGRMNWVSTVKLPLLDEEGNVGGTFGISRDITELKQLMEELEAARKEADRANRAKSEFLANMSHEIRTPMNAVLGYAELLSPLLKEKFQKDYLESIRASGNSLLTLINDILDLSKIEAGKLDLQFEYINTVSFFREMEHIFSYKIAEKGLTFQLDLSSGTPEGIYIDEIRLRQVLVNLLGNAIKFTQKGYVKLSVWTENPQLYKHQKGRTEEYVDLVIEVEDTGVGISKEFQGKIFDAFQQEEETSTKTYGGTGLGLAITKRIVELMKGNITVNSKLNEGSKFKVLIPEVPFIRDFDSHEKELYIDPNSIVFEKSTVLVVDDVEHNRKFLIDALRDTDLILIEAENGDVALNLAGEIIPNLVITDIRMPVMDGFELLEKIKSDDRLKEVPVVAYSASVMKSQKIKILDSAFAGLLMKPVQLADLYLELINHLPHRLIITDQSIEQETQDEKLPDSVLRKLPELIAELESDLYTTWKSFSKRQPMGELQKFAETILVYGKSYRVKVLQKYGQDLIAATDEFNIKETLSLIKMYPNLIEKMKGLAGQS